MPEMISTDGYYREIGYFLSCIEQDRDPQHTTPQQSRDAVALALAEAESICTGKVIEI